MSSLANLGCIAVLVSASYTPMLFAESSANPAATHISGSEETIDSLGEDYKKLLEIGKKKKKPVQVIDGSLNIAGRPGIGRRNAEVFLVEFGDFQCPFCKRHFLTTAKQIRDQLVSTNQVRYVFLDFPKEDIHPFAKKAAAAARCAEEQGKYWEMRTVLYNNQRALFDAFLVEHAKTAGLDESVFSRCLGSGRYDLAIREDQIVGKSLGVSGTPTFFLGVSDGKDIRLVRKILGAQPYAMFEREILRVSDLAVRSE